MKRGHRLEGQPSTNHHVDTLAFWKDAFKKSEDAQNELRAKVFELEKRLEARIEHKIENPVFHIQRKRGLDNATAERARTTASKRLKPAESTLSGSEGFLAAIADDVKHLSDRKGKDLISVSMVPALINNQIQAFFSTTYTSSSSWRPREI